MINTLSLTCWHQNHVANQTWLYFLAKTFFKETTEVTLDLDTPESWNPPFQQKYSTLSSHLHI